MGRFDDARKILKSVVAEDPLDFLTHNELILISDESERAANLESLRHLMRDEVQSYLELATDYRRLGFLEEAIEVLERPVALQLPYASSYPMVYYYLGYYSKLNGGKEKELAYYEQASEMSPDYAFPFRLESIEALKAAMDARPLDGRSSYYLGNLLYEHQPEEAIQAWERSRSLDKKFAATHRNLGWAYYYYEKDIPKAIASYELAIEHNNQDPRLFSELDRMYEAGNVDPQKRYSVLKQNHEVVAQRNYSFLREIMVQVLVGEYDQAITHLKDNYFHVREGGGEIHDVFVDAHLLRGLQAMERKDYEAALRDFENAAEYPENLSVGIPRRDRRAPQVAYFTATALDAQGNRELAKEYYEKGARQGQTDRWPESRYYQALSLERLDRNDTASEIYTQLVREGRRRLEGTGDADFFAKFGEQETANARRAMGYYIMGLGHRGQGQDEEARRAFAESVKLNVSNLWASYYAHR
jgi:tetratricopeptide (TPR) repeat protein